jgi:valyl-tRNA synthetase
MDKTFDPAGIERRIAARWEETGAFASGRPERAGAEPYTIVIPPPNVTGSLHIGHALNNTLQDVLARYFRMKGRDVLWQPGVDHAGIATQMVVERELQKSRLPGRREMGREAFVAKVWEWKEHSGGTIMQQLRRLGASCDWSRMTFTLGEAGRPDEQMVRAVTEFFVRLHEEGLLYKDRRLVNWDPKFQTAISDLEVEQIEIKGSFKWERPAADDPEGKPLDLTALGKLIDRQPGGHLYHVDYPLEDGSGFITVATTRPETLLGDTGIAVHPEDARYTALVGKRARLPLVGRLIPIVADPYSDPEKGSGAVKITPAHDFNDFEVGKRQGLAAINILNADATLNADVPEAYRRLTREAARTAVIADLHAAGLLSRIEPTTHTVPHGDRSGVVIEPWLTPQWYVNVKPLAERSMAAVKAGETRIQPANRENDFFRWMENIEPWCVSRQLWWGHRIPAWYGPDGDYVVARDEADARRLADAKWGASAPIQRDPDVLDTWFSSALWPFSTLGWPDANPLLARRYPTSALVTGFDILFFWVARMMMAGLFTQGAVPFRNVYLHGLVRDEKGNKMSKTLGNVIDPLEVVDAYGADALRFTLVSMAAQNRDPKLGPKTTEPTRNFCTKIWNAARFCEMNGCIRVAGFDPASVRLPLSRWIIGELQEAIAAVSAGIEGFRFNDAAQAAWRFVWNTFCDWHLELAKPLLQGEEKTGDPAEVRAVTAFVLDEALKLLHPFMPFITEELWAIKGEVGPPRETMLVLAAWSDGRWLEPGDAAAEVGFVVDLVTAIRSVRQEMNVPAASLIPLVLVGGSPAGAARLSRWGETIRRLARLSDISLAAEAPGQSAQLVVAGETWVLPLAEVIDIAAEKARLARELAKVQAEAAGIAAKLANPAFVARAPEEVIDENRERLAAADLRKARIEEALVRL